MVELLTADLLTPSRCTTVSSAKWPSTDTFFSKTMDPVGFDVGPPSILLLLLLQMLILLKPSVVVTKGAALKNMDEITLEGYR